jgi:hypothetical protein
MAENQRIKGQEVNILIVVGSELQDQLTEISDFEFNDEQEILQQGFLGQTTDQYDYVYKGTKGKLTLQIHTSQYFEFRKKINDKATRKSPDTRFNLTATANFPNGEKKRILFPNVSWGNIGHGIPGRTEYVKISMDWATSSTDESDA